MIYAKIYVDENSDLIFDSIKKDVRFYCSVAQTKKGFSGRSYRVPRTTIIPTSGVVISPEAKTLFENWLNPENPNLAVNNFDGDFELFDAGVHMDDGDSGLGFSFKPSNETDTFRRLKSTDKFTICIKKGINLAVLEDFTQAPNELIKNLNISEPVNESELSPSSGGPTGPSSN